jgi:phage-related protein
VAKAELILEFKDKVTAGLRNVEGQLQSLSKTASTIKFASLVSAISAVIDVGKQLGSVFGDFINAGKEGVQSGIQLNAVLRNLAGASSEQIKQIKEYLHYMSEKYEIEDNELQRLSALAFSYGVQGNQLERLIKTAKAYSLMTGKDMQTAMLDLIKGGEGLTSSLKRMGIVLDESKLKTHGLSYVLEVMEKRFPYLDQYINSSAGTLDRLKTIFNNLKGQIGEAILNSDAFKEVLNVVISIVTEGISVLSEFSGAFDSIGEVIKELGKIVGAFWEAVKPILHMAAKLLNLVLEIIAKIVDAIGDKLLDVIKYVAKGVGYLYAGFEALWAAISRGLQGVSYLLKGDVKKAMEEFKRVPQDLKNTWNDTTSSIGKAIDEAFEKGKKALDEVKTSSDDANEKLKKLGEESKNNKKIIELTREELEYLKRTWEDVSMLQADFLDTLKKLSDVQSEAIERSDEWLNQIEEEYDMFDKIYQIRLHILTERFNTLNRYVSSFVNSIWEGVKAGKSLGEVLRDTLKELTEAIVKEIIFALIEKAIMTALNLPTTPSDVGGILSLFTELPSYQEGGIVERPTLAIVGEREREYIIPESKFPQPVVYVNVHNANPDTYAEVFVKMSKRARRMIYSRLMEA